VSGATDLGDGKVVLILDLPALAAGAGRSAAVRRAGGAANAAARDAGGRP
jgi:chemotaxis protein histidine kinase CheA